MTVWREELRRLVQAVKIDAAITLALKVAKKHDPNEVAEVLVEHGIMLGKEKSLHKEALSLFEVASKISTKEACKRYANHNASVALTIIGSALAEEGRLKEAEKLFKKAIDLNPVFALAHQSYARCLHLLGKKRKAEHHFKEALKLDPKNANTHVFYAIFLECSRRPSSAINHLEKAIELEPNNSVFHTLLGIAAMEIHHYDRAENELKKAIDLSPNNLDAYYNYGVLLSRISRWSEARDQFKKVFDIDPSFKHVKELYSHSILKKHSLEPEQPITEEWFWARQIYFEIERPKDIEEFSLMEQHKKEWKIIYDQFSCEMCGRCCKRTKWATNLDTRLVWEDIERWRSENRQDILQHVFVFEGLGGDFLDLENKKFFSKCPFLKKEDKKYVCLIHETKPTVCKVTPFYFHIEERCENCKAPIGRDDVYCENCGIFLKVDPHMLLLGCPGLKKTLKRLGLYRPFHKFDVFEMLRLRRHERY